MSFSHYLLFYFTSRNSRDENLQVTIRNKLKLLRCPKTKRSRYGLRKKKEPSPGFRVFDFALCPKSKTWKSNSSNSDNTYKSRFKNDKIWTRRKTERFWYRKNRKNEIFPDFRVFGFALHPKSKSRKSRKVLFYLIIYNFTQCCCIKIARR